MGVDLGGLFKTEEISFQNLHDKIIAIDAYNVLHQFLSIIRQRDGTPLKDSQGRITSHLSGLFYRTANMVEALIKPVFVFDGAPHSLKLKKLEERKIRKEQAEIEWKQAQERGDLETARIKAQQTSRVTDEIIIQSKELLSALGIPYVDAPSEGEAQASYMVKKGDAFAVGSQDFDCLLFGCPVLIRNLTSSGKRKLPGKKAYVSVSPELIRLKNNLEQLKIDQKQLVDMAILVGTDFNKGIKGIGPKKSLDIIKKTGNLEKAMETLNCYDLPDYEEIKEIRKIFLEPNVTDDYSLSWSATDKEKVLSILCEKHQFTRDRVEPILEKFSSLKDTIKQKTLF
jgi:flap endonuclease-1